MANESVILEILALSGLDLQEYSGRGMYGKTCVGVQADSVEGLLRALVSVALGLTDPAEVEALEAFTRDLRTDSLGTGIIAYSPNTPWPKD